MLPEVSLGLETLFIIFLAIWVLGLTFWVYKAIGFYKRLISGVNGSSLGRVLERLLNNQNKLEGEVKNLKNHIVALEDKTQFHIQKIGLVKFSPYSETGGKQSFALSLLNEKDTGVVLLSLHNREETRIYIKQVQKGGSNYELSKEEKLSIEEAKKNQNT